MVDFMASNDDIIKAINSLKGVKIKKNVLRTDSSPVLHTAIELAPQCEVRYLIEQYKKNGQLLPQVDSYADVSGYDNQDMANSVYRVKKESEMIYEMQKHDEEEQKENSTDEKQDNQNTVAVAAASSQQAGDK